MGSSRTFYQQYRNVGGHNGHFDFPGGGDNGWGSWSAAARARCPATSSAPSANNAGHRALGTRLAGGLPGVRRRAGTV